MESIGPSLPYINNFDAFHFVKELNCFIVSALSLLDERVASVIWDCVWWRDVMFTKEIAGKTSSPAVPRSGV